MTESDVLVVGSGAAALAAALTAAVGGASVTVLERTSRFGGTSAVSGGGMWLPGNTLDPDYTDDLDGAKRYLQKLTLGLVEESVLDAFLDEAGRVPDFFAENSPLTFTADIDRPDYHAPMDGSSGTSRTVFPSLYEMPRLGDMDERVRRPGPGGIPPIQHSEEAKLAREGGAEAINDLLKERAEKGIALRGLALVGGLIEGCLDKGVTFISDTRARELIKADDRVVGVRAEQAGKTVEYRATKGVVLASGGFEWNEDLWKAFMGVPWDGPASPPVNEGDALIMASEAGAKLANLDKATWIPTRNFGEEYEGREYRRSGLGAGYGGEIMVNRAGKRFANENLNYNDIGMLMTRLDTHNYEYVNHPAYVIGDKRGYARATAKPTSLRTQSGDQAADPNKGDGYVEGQTIREVAEQLGIDPDGLEQQVKEFNEHAVNSVDPVFHRGEKPWELHVLGGASDLPNKAIGPILEPPFYGYRIRAGVFGTRGGPVINENAQIVDYRNKPIPGLFGAGNAVAHPFANAYPGGGGTLGPCVTFGYIAGKTILGER